MLEKGVIRDKLSWASSRVYLYHRINRRLFENEVIQMCMSELEGFMHGDCEKFLMLRTMSMDMHVQVSEHSGYALNNPIVAAEKTRFQIFKVHYNQI